MRKPRLEIEHFKLRRQKLKDHSDSAFILFAAPEIYHVPYRQDSNFYYLTGFEEPGSIAVIRPGKSPEFVLFVRPKNPEMELWDGFRFGVEGAQAVFAADQVFEAESFSKEVVSLLKDVEKVYYRAGVHAANDRLVLEALESARKATGRSGKGLLPILDPQEVIGEMRIIKSDVEQNILRKACSISAQAHRHVMKLTRPGMNERAIWGQLLAFYLGEGCIREGYTSIIAGGANACTLHYVFNDEVLKDGDFVLIDSGGEYNYLTADITRTFPVNGRFSPAQRDLYQGVLKVQKDVIAALKIGLPYARMQEIAIEGLTEVMKDLKLFPSRMSKEEIITSTAYRKYYPHGIGHLLGMDVHDVGRYQLGGSPRPLEAGMSFTVEPGLYVPANDESAPSELRGLGVRIEDDILMTSSGPEVMTHEAPKEISELESILT